MADLILRTCESDVFDDDENYLRAVPPAWVDSDGCPMRRGYQPSSKDDPAHLSGARSRKQDAAGLAAERAAQGRKVAGVWGHPITMLVDSGVRVVCDELCPGVEATGHTYLDMTEPALAALGLDARELGEWLAMNATPEI